LIKEQTEQAGKKNLVAMTRNVCHGWKVSEESDTVTIRELRSGSTTKRILAGERLTLRMGRHLIADIVPRAPANGQTLDEILAPVKAAAQKARPGKNLILEDRERFRR
jgi:hypothetical protein